MAICHPELRHRNAVARHMVELAPGILTNPSIGAIDSDCPIPALFPKKESGSLRRISAPIARIGPVFGINQAQISGFFRTKRPIRATFRTKLAIFAPHSVTLSPGGGRANSLEGTMQRSNGTNTINMMLTLVWVLIGVTLANVSRADSPRILTIGDSLMASHAISGRSVSDFLGKAVGADVTDRSVLGAHMVYNLPISGALGLSIPAQFTGKENWDWVVMTGGGNDLWLGCGCGRCDRRMNKLISADGTSGKIPQLMAKIRRSGAQVIYVGYLRSPGLGSPIEHCRDDGDQLEARVAQLAKRVDGIHFVNNADLVPHGDRSFHAFDMIHPSTKATRHIAGRVAKLIKRVSG